MLYNLEKVPTTTFINLNNDIPQEVPLLNSTDLATPLKLSNNLFSTELKSLRNHIAYYENAVLQHPIATMIRQSKLPVSGEKSLAMYLFMDSWMWPLMLISMRDHVSHPQLKTAIENNLQDEAGERGVSHIKMCIDFIKSLGFIPALNDMEEINRTINVSCKLSQAQIAGWLAGAEILTLPLYQLALACFATKPQVDLRYLNVHMQVDEEHILWLWEAVVSLIEDDKNSVTENEILEGIALGARATLKALDEIYEEVLADL